MLKKMEKKLRMQVPPMDRKKEYTIHGTWTKQRLKKCYYSIICKKKQNKFHLIDKVHEPGTQKVFVGAK